MASTRPGAAPADADAAGREHAALYDGGPLLPLSAFGVAAPWVAVAGTVEEAAALASSLPTEGGEVVVVSSTEPGWRARLALLPPDCAVAVALASGGSGAAILPVLRALERHPGFVLLVDVDASDGLPRNSRVYRTAQRSRAALVAVDIDGPAVALVHRRHAAPWAPSADRRRGRLAALAWPGARLAAVGAAGIAGVGSATWPCLVDYDRHGEEEPTWAERGAPRPDVVLLDGTAPNAAGVRQTAETLSVRVLEVAGDGPPVIEPTADNPVGWIREPSEGVLELTAYQDPPKRASVYRHARVLGAGAPPASLAHLIVRLCARGLPVTVSDPPEGVWELLGPGVRGALELCDRADFDDLDVRERASVALRRAALAEHSADTAAREAVRRAGLEAGQQPAVTVLVATRRHEFLQHLLAQVAAQAYPELEVVLVAHAPGVAEAARAVLATHDLPHAVVDADPDRSLGAALDAGVAAMSGEVLAKMDDDDWYGPHHVGDCVAALRYSGAPLVGKGAEFCWLAAAGRTIRRSSRNAERYHAGVAGASLAISRNDLADLGGWAHQSRAVDRRLIDAVHRAGERTYRLHGLELCVNRHDEGSTWTADTDYFLRAAEAQWPGQALDKAGIDG